MTRLPQETNDLNGGWQREYRFPNGYGASVVAHRFSYGQELAVLNWNAGGALAYYTPLTANVIGHLSDEDREDLLDQIEALPTAPGEAEHLLLNRRNLYS